MYKNINQQQSSIYLSEQSDKNPYFILWPTGELPSQDTPKVNLANFYFI